MTSKTWASRRVPAASLTRVEETPSHADDVNDNTNGGSPTLGRKMGVTRLPSIKEKRPRKPRASSFNDAITDSSSMPTTSTSRRDSVISNGSSSTTITTTSNNNNTSSNGPPPALARRASIPQPQSPTITGARRPSRPTFAGIGRRVSSLVRARLAFQTQRKSRDETEVNHMSVIHEMPRNARFTSFMSPEAQYAVMKGYEDKLYEKIANTSPPDVVPALNRNRTPFRTKISFDDPAAPDDNNNNDDSSRAGTTTPHDHDHSPDGTGHSSTTPAATRINSFSLAPDANSASFSSTTSSSSSSVALPSPFLKPLRRPSMDANGNSTSPPPASSMSLSGQHQFQQRGGTDGENGWTPLQRAHSMSSLSTTPGASAKKRLVLTYRLESAMDILDTLNRRNKENALSPRVVRLPRKVDAVRDFNSWTEVWNKEFKEVKVK